MNIHKQVAQFAAKWEQQEGYKPAPFQKAIAMQRLERGQSIQDIIDALVKMITSNRPTRYHELAYTQHAPKLWRIIATDTNQAVGPFYATKAELLADLNRYAKDFGCDNA